MTESVTRAVLVDAAPQRAFDLFVGHFNAWWPLDRHGVFGDGSVMFERDRLVERSGEQESVWGEVTEWNPPAVLALAWHPGYDAWDGTDLRITFVPDGGQTLVTLTHSGWERTSDPDAAAEEYGHNWPNVLARFVELVDETN